MKRRILRIFGTALVLFALFVAYQGGLLHNAASRLSKAVGIEWDVSSPQAIRFYFPRWACGEAQPPYLLVETDDAANAALIGAHIRIANDEAIDFDDHSFAECHGRFKTTLAMLIWEHYIMRVEGWRDDGQSVTGRFFEAESCRAIVPSLEQTLTIDKLMQPYQESE